jgi:hypothetical protein
MTQRIFLFIVLLASAVSASDRIPVATGIESIGVTV